MKILVAEDDQTSRRMLEATLTSWGYEGLCCKFRRLVGGGNCYVTDNGLKILGTMLSLEELDLEWNDHITDAGLVHLHILSNLQWLDIDFVVGSQSKAWVR